MFSSSVFILWAVTTLCKVWLLIAFRNYRFKIVPAYLWVTFLKSMLLWVLALSRLATLYAWAYHLGGFVEHAGMLLVIYHLARTLLFPLATLPPGISRGALSSLVFLFVALAIHLSLGLLYSPSRAKGLVSLLVERSILLLQLGAIAVMCVVARHLRIPWRKSSSWIAFGLVVYLSVESVAHVAGKQWAPGAYLLMQVAWIVGAIQRDPLHRPSSARLKSVAALVNSRCARGLA